MTFIKTVSPLMLTTTHRSPELIDQISDTQLEILQSMIEVHSGENLNSLQKNHFKNIN